MVIHFGSADDLADVKESFLKMNGVVRTAQVLSGINGLHFDYFFISIQSAKIDKILQIFLHEKSEL